MHEGPEGERSEFNGERLPHEEETIRESEACYRSLFMDNPAVMLLIDPTSGKILDASSGACAFYGYSRAELLAMSITEINTLPPEQVFEAMARTASGVAGHFQFRHRLASGEVRDVEVYAGPMAHQGRTRLYSVVHDITERVRAERMRERLAARLKSAKREARRSAEEAARRADELHAIFTGMADPVIIYDRDGVPVEANPAAVESLGFNPVGMVQAEFMKRLQVRRPDGESARVDEMPPVRALAGETVRRERFRLSVPGQGEITALISASPLWSDGSLWGAVVLWDDITTAERTQELAETLNRLNVLITSTLDVDGVMGQVLSDATRAIGSEAAAVYYREAGEWVVRHVYGFPRDAVGQHFTDERAVATAMAAAIGKPITVEDAFNDPRVNATIMRQFGAQSTMIVPLIVREEVVGAISFSDLSKRASFSPLQLDFATKLAVSLSLGLKNAWLYTAERRQRELFQAVADNAPVALFLLDDGLRVKWCNASAESFLRAQSDGDDPTGRHIADYLPWLEEGGLADIARRTLATGEPFRAAEYEYPGLDSAPPLYCDLSMLRIWHPAEQEPSLMVLVSDETDRVRARLRTEELARSTDAERRRLRAILDTLPVGVFVADDQGRVIETNAQARQIWGADALPASGMEQYARDRGWWADSGEPLRPEEWALARAVAQGEVSVGQVIDVLRVDGARRTILNSASPIQDEAGRIIGGVAVVQDITERRRIEAILKERTEELEERNRELDAFAHTVAHDLKNPLMFVRYADVLETEWEGMSRDEISRALHLISSSGQWMSNIIRELLLLAELRQKEVPLQPLNMALILMEALESLRFMVEETQASIQIVGDWPAAFGYAPWVRQVWVNYLSNAMKYGGDKPRIEVGADQIEGAVRFWVRDYGPGFRTVEKDELFVPFSQVARVRAEGQGLGLSIVRHIVEKLGGSVGAESGGPTQGTTFWFALRAADWNPRP